MSAWYILSSLGLFALCPGKPDWALGAPLFPSAEIRFPEGRSLRINAKSKKAGAFYNQVTLDGAVQHDSFIPHAALLRGSRLDFLAL